MNEQVEKFDYINKKAKNQSKGNSRTRNYYIWNENVSEPEDISKELPNLNNKDQSLRTKGQWLLYKEEKRNNRTNSWRNDYQKFPKFVDQ